ncbi:Leucine-rich repeat-containing protein 45 [Chionoecetes opilio]|uniref:Leucine-rich repeat-containing protein 45 n=1 Tax=Chionoecetes opilio TaxID=41210 RepID=A0A8J5CL51_CHIOP|nr:Leucine-rich repeat-containing protein 45 [Chionoecetes opilio]
MGEAADLYKQLCRKHNIEPQECAQKALMGGAVLDLSGQALDVGTCAVVGKMMQVSSKLDKISFEDCLLNEDGIKSILLGLCGNSSVKTLVLKGNNIQSSSTNALAKMLRHNATIVRLSLEWNNLGMHLESFASFCGALAKNSAIQHLDLRSNQLGAEAAAALANVLMRNCSLLTLDLCWNNLGVAGGKTLLESLRNNRTLVTLNLIGNNITNDIISTIDDQISKNKLLSVKEKEYIGQTTLLKEQLERREQFSSQQLKQLEDNLAQRDFALNKTLQEGEFQTGRLEEQLSSKSLEVQALRAKYEVVSSALHLSQERVAVLEQRNHSVEEELKSSQESAIIENSKIKEALATAQAQHGEEVLSLRTATAHLQAKVSELTSECEKQKQQNFDLRETTCSLQAEVKGLKVESEAAVSKEKTRHKEVMRSLEKQHSAEVHQFKLELQQLETEMREKLASAEAWKVETQAEVASLQVQLSTERSSSQTQLLALKKQLKAEHSVVIRGLEEQLHVMEESRGDAEERLRSQVAANSGLRATTTKLTSQIHALHNDITELQAKEESWEGEVKSAEKRVREEFSAQVEELQLECKQIPKLKNSISEQKRLISDLEHERDLHKREAKMKEDELKKVHEDEARRVAMLHSAFVSYFNSSPGLPSKPT